MPLSFSGRWGILPAMEFNVQCKKINANGDLVNEPDILLLAGVYRAAVALDTIKFTVGDTEGIDIIGCAQFIDQQPYSVTGRASGGKKEVTIESIHAKNIIHISTNYN